MPSALTVTFVQSTVLNALSNILAQLIDQRNNTVIIPISQAKAKKKKRKRILHQKKES